MAEMEGRKRLGWVATQEMAAGAEVDMARAVAGRAAVAPAAAVVAKTDAVTAALVAPWASAAREA
jgi:hypothetical protein